MIKKLFLPCSLVHQPEVNVSRKNESSTGVSVSYRAGLFLQIHNCISDKRPRIGSVIADEYLHDPKVWYSASDQGK